MAFDFELTISGLCVIVLKSQEDRPEKPQAVDILCAAAHHHRSLLSYLPGDVLAVNVEPALNVDPTGGRIASLDLSDKVVDLHFQSNPHTDFSLKWSTIASTNPPEEGWMDWVPSLSDIGFQGLQPLLPGELPTGAGARLSLPPGELASRNVVHNQGRPDYALWKFPAAGNKKQAVANEVVYKAFQVEDLTLDWGEADTHLRVSGSGGIVRMAISNDMAFVPQDYSDDSGALEHLSHLGGLTSLIDTFMAPSVSSSQRTGHPICNQVLFIDKG
jgi:hypothetical protein